MILQYPTIPLFVSGISRMFYRLTIIVIFRLMINVLIHFCIGREYFHLNILILISTLNEK